MQTTKPNTTMHCAHVATGAKVVAGPIARAVKRANDTNLFYEELDPKTQLPFPVGYGYRFALSDLGVITQDVEVNIYRAQLADARIRRGKA